MAKVVTITNPVTGQPAQVDQLDHTAQQIDDAVAAARWSHRNLLDNAYWANPDAIIDQRGGYVVPPGIAAYRDAALSIPTGGATDMYYRIVEKTSTYGRFVGNDSLDYYVAASNCVRGYVGAGYTIDRLKMVVPGVLLITDNGVNLKLGASTYGYSVFRMLIDGAKKLLGKTVTLSILTTNGLFSNSGVLGSAPSWSTAYVSSSYARPYFDGDLLTVEFIVMSDNDPDLIAAKLELGDKQTLAHQDEDGNWVLNDPPPDKGMELAKCQRYQIPIGASAVYSGQTNSSKDTTGAFFIPLPVSMRATPVIANLSLDTWAIRCNGVSKTPTAITVSGITPNGVTCAFACETGFGVRQSVVIYKADGKELLDANL